MPEDTRIRSTTIVAVRRNGRAALAGDGQVSLGQTILKDKAKKVRRIADGKVVVGFAGATADAFALLERLEQKLKEHRGSLARALRRLEAMIIAVDAEHTFLLSGTGDVIEPDDGIIAIGSGGMYALAAGRALLRHTELSAAEVARSALEVAGEICVYTNSEIVLEEVGS
jgi:ATP-dependent HslUV protease, peptidase subunit HslV